MCYCHRILHKCNSVNKYKYLDGEYPSLLELKCYLVDHIKTRY